jgi:hypothetical protein
MWRRSILSVALAALAALVLGLPALAGGWAITTVDALPTGGFQAGETYRLGYTIRQHGQTPFVGAKPWIKIQASSGESHVFPGVPEGAPGHYVSEVRFPAAGQWTWEVDQSPFGPQALGKVTVLPAATEVSGPAPEAMVGESAPLATLPQAPRTDNPFAGLFIALPLGALPAIALIVWRIAAVTRRRGATVPQGPAERARVS